ncbi:unnamed protein product [Parnassius apollo]|uniref:(apollo) hypothetical protein n=1 Tax=Parnassius apollo TaxID=110799 RepID=A0A8S3Y8P1_PARAO|nr:unnamed protein product [Parnassius apollo]
MKEDKRTKETGDSDALESVLSHVGELGCYQKLMLVLMLPCGVFFAFVYFSQMFIMATPQRHWCRVPELEHLSMEIRSGSSSTINGVKILAF